MRFSVWTFSQSGGKNSKRSIGFGCNAPKRATAKRFAKSDEIRLQIEKIGFEVLDSEKALGFARNFNPHHIHFLVLFSALRLTVDV